MPAGVALPPVGGVVAGGGNGFALREREPADRADGIALGTVLGAGGLLRPDDLRLVPGVLEPLAAAVQAGAPVPAGVALPPVGGVVAGGGDGGVPGLDLLVAVGVAEDLAAGLAGPMLIAAVIGAGRGLRRDLGQVVHHGNGELEARGGGVLSVDAGDDDALAVCTHIKVVLGHDRNLDRIAGIQLAR